MAKSKKKTAEPVDNSDAVLSDAVRNGAGQDSTPQQLEAVTQQVGDWLWQRLHRRQPSIFDRRWWDDRLLQWAMADEAVKVQMFRFIDVLPMLNSHEQVARHLHEYFEEVEQRLPGAARLVLHHSEPNSVLGRALAFNARRNARRMAERFIAGQSHNEVLRTILKLRKQGFAFTLDWLGEAVLTEPEANAYKNNYLELLSEISETVNGWTEDTQIDCDDRGPIARVNVSLKLSALNSQFRPIDPVGSSETVKNRLRPILRRAQKQMAHVHIDMEQYAFKNQTLAIFKDVLMEDEFREWSDVGIVIQAYLPDSERDLLQLREWVEKRGTPITVRLVKGAYWDYENVISQQRGWPLPVFSQKWQSDENFERLSLFLMQNYQWLRPAFGSHNLRSLAHAIACGRQLNVPTNAYEIQMLYGMATEQAQLFRELGHRVRIYTPFGEMLSGMAYLVRRLLENTSNDSFLRHSLSEDISRDLLMTNPSTRATTSIPAPQAQPEFVNESPADFSREDVRQQMQEAIDFVSRSLGEHYQLVIGGRRNNGPRQSVSTNPSKLSQQVGTFVSSNANDAANAIAAAVKARDGWANSEIDRRAEFVEQIGELLKERRFELAAWEIFECGKTWTEADADVAEAIDFCKYYAQQARLYLAPREVNLAGENNTYFYRARGVCAVIAPWNFPLAILCGMTAAALVTGNTVIMKPAEQSSIMAAKLMEVMQAVGIPEGVVNYLTGDGEEIGRLLVQSPDVAVIAFTGSREVGLEINRLAAESPLNQPGVKKVIAEMGGKNAIIVDDDADLDEAVQGVIQSAFGYSGQKCSACSRVIVLKEIYPQFAKRLVAAARSLKVGPATEASSFMGPVINREAYDRLKAEIAAAKSQHNSVLEYPLDPELAKSGYYIGPHIFVDVDAESDLARKELFGPVLALIPVKDMTEAINVANSTEYALTVGVFSRSPANLKRCATQLQAGNLYLNRAITGALVNRQPFGGFKYSGIGTKAGGPDYLSQFVIPINITENSMRHGFAPTAESTGTASAAE